MSKVEKFLQSAFFRTLISIVVGFAVGAVFLAAVQIDVGAIEYVHRYIVEQRNKGKAVLLVSFELDEIMSLSDRIDVIFDGAINGSMLGSEADESKLGLMMAGGKAE